MTSTISNKRQPYVSSEQAGRPVARILVSVVFDMLCCYGLGAFVRMCGGGRVFVPTKTYSR
ncbi:uncharacterized protein [Musca autumnalis]|uniref:uncharacterized protein n=1 Tax=Musca autumnalis TaxID=221902 RepID=UPI003CE9B330